ncbi:hypothetical protein QYM36_010661 [Artemia franciscana]|uniref:Peptidase M14 domain-containing protein n=1 Tax=Artemia franciscana TaxID=6661 RepID=A0AA88L257_ARTSF|nr:hypothetical protein QYM36_010661 [Artemia franciscana]
MLAAQSKNTYYRRTFSPVEEYPVVKSGLLDMYKAKFDQSPLPQPPPPALDFTYHNYTVMADFLRKTAAAYPQLAKLYSIGKSVQGRDLWVILVTNGANQIDIGKPNVKIVGNIHGNEAVGREVSLHLIEYLLAKYHTEPYVKWLLDHTKIHILPSLNPDGFEVSREGSCQGGQGRYNAMGFDLNRNFPDYFKTNMKHPQQETEAYKSWIAKENFVLSASLHGGALVVTYPFDNSPNAIIFKFKTVARFEIKILVLLLYRFCAPTVNAVTKLVELRLTQPYITAPALTPDTDVFKYLASSYASTHPTMHQGLPCKPGAAAFQNGTVNGAAWYPLVGGAQDYNYIWGGCLEITIEMSCCKYPPAAELPAHWEDHRLALLQLLGEARRGVRGMTVDGEGVPIPLAEMRIRNRDVGFKSSSRGEYWRILLPGDYIIEVYKGGYEPREIAFKVVDDKPTILNIVLKKVKDIKLKIYSA